MQISVTVLYKNLENKRPNRKKRTINITIQEKPERPVAHFRSNKDRVKYIKHIERVIRRSLEYKDFIRMLKLKMGMNKCAVFPNIENGNGKKYSIEVHHEPFTLFDIVNIVMVRRESENESINVYDVADEVLELHYAGLIGLISLSVTIHELVGCNQVFIPLQWIYHDYHKFYELYSDYIDENIREKIELKAELSLKCGGKIMSNVLDPEFVYFDIDGFDVVEYPDSWAAAIQKNKDCSLESEEVASEAEYTGPVIEELPEETEE